MELKNCRIGFAVTGSFCTIGKAVPKIAELIDDEADVTPIMSEIVYNTDTRFGCAYDLIETVEGMCGKSVIHTIEGAEPIGPKQLLDVLIIAPCTGNTLSKLANGINDSAVCMAAKAHLRNNRPVVLAICTNDGLGASAKNIGMLLNVKNIFFVPMIQDDPVVKQKSLEANLNLIKPTAIAALENKQLQPVFWR